jgi:hypothetical protein
MCLRWDLPSRPKSLLILLGASVISLSACTSKNSDCTSDRSSDIQVPPADKAGSVRWLIRAAEASPRLSVALPRYVGHSLVARPMRYQPLRVAASVTAVAQKVPALVRPSSKCPSGVKRFPAMSQSQSFEAGYEVFSLGAMSNYPN